MDTTIWGKFSEYGLVGIIIGILFLILFKMLIWVMAFVKDIQKQQSEERVGWLATLSKHNDLLNKISNNIDEHDKRAEERGRFVRSEHEKMIENLTEQGKILSRINGFK